MQTAPLVRTPHGARSVLTIAAAAALTASCAEMRPHHTGAETTTPAEMMAPARDAALGREMTPPSPGMLSLELTAFPATVDAPGEAVLALRVQTAFGWHIYDQLPESAPYAPTALQLHLPEGVEPIGEWHTPESRPYNEPGITIYEGDMVFLHRVRVTDAAAVGELPVTATIGYQTCDLNMCMPPTSASAGGALRVRR